MHHAVVKNSSADYTNIRHLVKVSRMAMQHQLDVQPRSDASAEQTFTFRSEEDEPVLTPSSCTVSDEASCPWLAAVLRRNHIV